MITRKQIEEILYDTLEGDNPPDSAPTVVGKEECVNRLMELVKNCSIPDVSNSVCECCNENEAKVTVKLCHSCEEYKLNSNDC